MICMHMLQKNNRLQNKLEPVLFISDVLSCCRHRQGNLHFFINSSICFVITSSTDLATSASYAFPSSAASDAASASSHTLVHSTVYLIASLICHVGFQPNVAFT